jgi:hypothetical protein
MSTYEGEHTIFGFLSQANLTQNDVERILLRICAINAYLLPILGSAASWGLRLIKRKIKTCSQFNGADKQTH